MKSGRSAKPLPARIGPYEVLEELGRGGMGVVYLGRDPRLERRIAIKTLSEDLSRDREWNTRFSREARLLASLNHPNIATIYSLESEGDLVYLTMELIPGQSLEAMVQSGSLSMSDALSIGRQVARGLEAAHGAGVIHRDLKPLNVMITPESHAKMLDFGLATRAPAAADDGDRPDVSVSPPLTGAPIPTFDAEGEAVATSGPPGSAADLERTRDSGSGSKPGRGRVSVTTGAGTPGYMSPEQIRGEDLDERTDIWAFGCVLYESLSGTRAFPGATLQERILSTLHGAADLGSLPAHTPAAIRELIRACLQTDREARPRNAAEARDCLESVLMQRSWDSPTPHLPGSTSRTAGATVAPNNLPNEVSPLIGRAREVAQVRELLDQSRLVTLNGIGGGGKTRLSIGVGAQSLDRFADGVWMVALAPATERAGVVLAAAKTLGVTESAGHSLTEAIIAHLAPRSLLLILDNCEHVVQAAAELAGKLLAAAPRLQILATSRETLGLTGESVFQVPPLQVPPRIQTPRGSSLPGSSLRGTPPQGSSLERSSPGEIPSPGSSPRGSSLRVSSRGSTPIDSRTFEILASTESVQLFAQRAGQLRRDFRLAEENIEDVAEICRRLEGIPLALELAAARTKLLAPAEIARRLDDRFRLLRGTTRAALPHHQTLEALIDWSHASLTENEQKLFRRLSLFRGGWTLAAAESVCADSELEEWEILDLLARLIDKSLVLFIPTDGSEPAGSPAPPREPRYRMLETVREYADVRLRESSDLRATEERFEGYFTKLAEAAAQELTGPTQSEWLARLDAEIDNLRAAIARSLEEEESLPALRITGPMLRYWMIRAHWREGRALLERVVAKPGAAEQVVPFGTVLNALGSCCFQLNDLDAAARHYQRAVDGFLGTGERRRAGPPLINLGNVYRLRGELDLAVASLHQSLQCFHESDQWMIAAVHLNLGGTAIAQENYDEARTHFETAVRAYQKLGDRVHAAMAVMNSGLVAYRQGRLAESRSLLEECAATFEEVGDRNIGANALANLGIVLLAMDAKKEALGTFVKVLRMVRETGNLENVAACLEGLSQLARPRGDVTRASQLAGAADAIRMKFAVVRQAPDQRGWEKENQAYAQEVGEEIFARNFEAGQALELDAAIELGLEMGEGEEAE